MFEPKDENDLFFTCSLIEYIARKTKNSKKQVINLLGEDGISKIYELADIYHVEPIDKVADEFIETKNINIGSYDTITTCKNRIPTYFEIGRVYEKLIQKVNSNPNCYMKTLMEVLSSWIIEKIDNYNSSMYYESIDYIYACYQAGKVL